MGEKKGQLVEGKYEYVWTPEGKWKEEITLPGYKRTRIGNETQLWQVRTTAEENPAVYELERLLGQSDAPKLEADDRFRKADLKRAGNIDIQCMRRETKSRRFVSYCFDAKTNDLLEVSNGSDSVVPWRVVWQEYAAFQEWSGKRWPRLMRGYNGKKLVSEVGFDPIKPTPQPAPDFFTPSAEAIAWAYCAGGAVWKLKDGMPPVYPPSARMQYREGTVEMSGGLERMATYHI